LNTSSNLTVCWAPFEKCFTENPNFRGTLKAEMPYRFLEDLVTADLAFEAYAGSIEELFQEAGRAISEAMVNTESLEGLLTKRMEIHSETLEGLLYDFLSEIVLLKDRDSVVFKQVKAKVDKSAQTYRLAAEAMCDKIDPLKHELRNDVKAVTYHMFEISRKNHGWYCRVVLDV
jgi:SHS2 domain-containing protein